MRLAVVIGGLLVAGAASLAPSPAAAQNTFKTGNWEGGPYFNGKVFSHCAVGVNFQNGTYLVFQLSARLEMFVGASKNDWNMTPTEQLPITFEFSTGFRKTANGRVTAERRNQVWFTIGNDPAFRQAVAGNGTMTWVDAQNQRFSFNLVGGDNAMRKLMACAALYGAD